ncbi:MAG: glutamine-hydrolyzing GMP synthase [Desulfurococcales archaeon]|nr:glutamine-hydrolyzing GMP synthase [Desulfurococcales archaeon]
MDREGVLVVDFGGQYAHLIARRVRELGRWSELVPASAGAEGVSRALDGARAVILSGGPASVWEESHDDVAMEVLRSGLPVLGICYGHQLLGKVLGGVVGPSPRPEFGPTYVEVLDPSGLLRGFKGRVRVWMSHNDAVLEPPPGARVLARSPGSPVAAMAFGRVYGVQWHPEVTHSWGGMLLLGNFLELAGVPGGWRPEDLVGELVEYVRTVVGGSTAISAISGGVDSTVATVIASKALGGRLVPVFIDHGLHPEGEVERVVEVLERYGIKVRLVDASSEFLEALRGVVDPGGEEAGYREGVWGGPQEGGYTGWGHAPGPGDDLP